MILWAAQVFTISHHTPLLHYQQISGMEGPLRQIETTPVKYNPILTLILLFPHHPLEVAPPQC